MLKSLKFFIQYFIFWLVFFAVNRIAFELWNKDKFNDIELSEVAKTFLHGMHMDASMSGYFCVIPFLTGIVCWLVPKVNFPKKALNIYTAILIIITVLVTIIDFNIYTEWGTKISKKVIDITLETPKEALASSSSSPLFKISVFAITLLVTAYFLYKICIPKSIIFTNKGYLSSRLIVSLLILSLTFLSIRGGWKIAPMNPSQVYFSNTPILNHSSLNANWLLISTYLKNSDDKNPFIYFSKEEANTLVSSLYSVKKDTTIKIIDNNNPNVVLFIIESFTADVVAELGGEENVTPHFSKIIEDGLLFTNIYSSSDRTDKGIIAILSAFPSQGSKSIIKENEKQEKLPSLPTELIKATYNTSFFYGGYSEFSNFKSYILSHQFQHLEDAELYERKDLTSKWGAYDEVTFNRHLNYLNKEKQPFFSTLLTLTNHEPFALPQKGQFGDKTVEDKFRSTSYYTSQHLFEYLNKAKKESWYKNTIFIFVADHGHRLPKNENEIYNPNRYHIPLLIYGEPLKKEFRGKKINTIGNQTDIAATLLAQLNLSSKQFKYSKNLMNPYAKSFSFYVWQDGFGFIDHQGSLSFDREANKTIYSNPKNIQQNQYKYYLNNGKALMQNVYQNYLDNQYQ